MFNAGLGFVFALGIVFTTFMLMGSWGGASWVFGSAVSITVGGLTLMRERQKVLTAVASLAVTALAVVVSLISDERLPQEPAPITALALSVHVAYAIRTLPTRSAAGIAVGGVAVTGVTWFGGWSGVTSLATMGMVAALVAGPALRCLDRCPGANSSASQGFWADSRRS
ncbi:metal transporter [Streptomyces sp. NPDC012510]|uniref:metal transporter n=1 Tax=Streptomyces sp. NPDC012510 TaxID=3364838 RepID=UPI0036E91313